MTVQCYMVRLIHKGAISYSIIRLIVSQQNRTGECSLSEQTHQVPEKPDGILYRESLWQ